MKLGYVAHGSLSLSLSLSLGEIVKGTERLVKIEEKKQRTRDAEESSCSSLKLLLLQRKIRLGSGTRGGGGSFIGLG